MKRMAEKIRWLCDSMFGQYKGMRKEVYVLFWGRTATNMGAMIWPMLTLILSNKLKMNASEIASVMLCLGLAQLPVNLLGGKLADYYNKKNLIVICDLVTVICYLLAMTCPISMKQIFLFFTASMFQVIEHPAYDALIADLTTAKDREKAYSLMYLGGNLGVVLAPSIGGFLFQNHLNLAYVIDGLTTLSSTVLIFLFIKDITSIKEKQENIYETDKSRQSTWRILRSQKVLLFYLICEFVYEFLYTQFNFLLPLNLEMLYGAQGAVYFGLLTSLNGFIVIVGTPILTKMFRKFNDTSKLIIGQVLLFLSMAMYIFIQGMIPMYFLSMVLLTLGEIFSAISSYPYLTRRIPASHRGRFSSVSYLFKGTSKYSSQWMVGKVLGTKSMVFAWKSVACMGGVGCILYVILQKADKKKYSLLYEERKDGIGHLESGS